MAMTRRQCFQAGGGLVALAAAGQIQPIWARDASGLPETMVWSSYDVGSAGYVEASAIADALGKKYGSKIRLQPSGSAIGRVQPLLSGRSALGWLATEVFFAVEGLYEYCTPSLGPQDLRTLAGRPTGFSIAVTRTSGIRRVEDLKGKRFAIARANSSITIKSEPILAFGGLTLDDVQLVEVPSYGASLRAMIEGRADAAGVAPTAAGLYELEASPQGVSWFQMSPDNKEGWERVRQVVPFVEPFQETIGAGLSDDNPVWMMGYRYPMITVRTDASADFTYAVLKAVDDAHDLFKDVSPVMARWDIGQSGTPPMDAAFHEGAIRYLKDIGRWSDDSDAWQQNMLRRHAALKQAWAQFVATDAAKSARESTLRELWMAQRAQVLDAMKSES